MTVLDMFSALQSLSWISIENAPKRNCFVCSNVYIYIKIKFFLLYYFFNLQWFVKLMQYLPPKVPKTRFSIRGSRGILRYWRHITQRSHQSSERKLCVVVLYYNSIHSIPDQFHTATFNVIFFFVTPHPPGVWWHCIVFRWQAFVVQKCFSGRKNSFFRSV